MSNNNYLKVYAKSFNWAGFFLPKETYKKCSALYDFCRVIDNIADEKNQIKIKQNKFEEFKNNFNKKNFDDSIIENMWKLINEFNISLKIIDDLFDGIESDIKDEVKLNSKKDLLVYSYRVAGTVGLMMAKILNVKNKEALKSAIDLGIAMQLTNISRDVIEDSKNNRYYIANDFDSIVKTIKLADLFYKSSFASIKQIPLSFRFSILVARRVYREIGHKILKKKNIENYKKSGKIYITNFGKIVQTFFSIIDLLRLSWTNDKYHLREKEHLLIKEEINLDERF